MRSAIDIAPMADVEDGHRSPSIIDLIDFPVISYSQAPSIAPS